MYEAIAFIAIKNYESVSFKCIVLELLSLIGIGGVIISQSKNSFPVPFKLKARKKSCRDFKDNSKKRLAWEDVAKQIKLQAGMYTDSFV